MMKITTMSALFLIAVITTPTAFAHGKKADSHANEVEAVQEQMPWGIAGNSEEISRTIDISMLDSMTFNPAALEIRHGETIRFIARNEGKVLHEFVLGTTETNDEHAQLMIRFPGMEHDEPYMAHVDTGKTGEIIWTFNREGTFDFACLIAGHYQAGMRGSIIVAAAS